MFCILVHVLSYPMPWPLRPLSFKSGLARSWVRLALGSRRPPRVGSCPSASGQTGNVFYGLQGTLVYPSYPVYPLYPVESAVDAGPLCLQCALVYPSYAVIWEREKLGKWKVSKGEKSGKEKSQETGTVRERGKSGKRQRQETGKVRKSLRIRCRHRKEPLCTVHSSLSLLSRLSLRCGSIERRRVSKGDKSGTRKSQERESQERGKARKRESYEPHIPDLSRLFRKLVLDF